MSTIGVQHRVCLLQCVGLCVFSVLFVYWGVWFCVCSMSCVSTVVCRSVCVQCPVCLLGCVVLCVFNVLCVFCSVWVCVCSVAR